MKRVIGSVLVLVVLAALMVGCSQGEQTAEEQTAAKAGAEYTQISQEKAQEMMKSEDVVVVDVRTQEEYVQGHIPGAICVPNESIVDAQPEELPDLGQTILVYCRSGRRSKEASQKLADIGYTNVYEFGGIIDWTGEVVTE